MSKGVQKTTTLKRGRKNTTSRHLKRKTASKRRARGGADPDEEREERREEMMLFEETQKNFEKANKFRKELESKVILENGEGRVLTEDEIETEMFNYYKKLEKQSLIRVKVSFLRDRLKKKGMKEADINEQVHLFVRQLTNPKQISRKKGSIVSKI